MTSRQNRKGVTIGDDFREPHKKISKARIQKLLEKKDMKKLQKKKLRGEGNA